MIKTFRIAFSLKNTYRVNGILYSLKQIPLVKKLLPESLYRVRGLKIFANAVSVLWEVVSMFLWKFLYFATMVCGIGALYEAMPPDRVFLHIFLFLTIIGAFLNTGLFNPTRDKYYALILMRMNAKEFALVDYGYTILKVMIGFLPCTLLFGGLFSVPLPLCLLLPFSVAGMKLTVAAGYLWDYEKRGTAYNENRFGKWIRIGAGLLLAAAYVLPAFGVTVPFAVSVGIFVAAAITGAVSICKILHFSDYRPMYQKILSQLFSQMDTARAANKKAAENIISADAAITSRKKGFEYLNELFIRRHRKILWKSSLRIAAVCLALFLLICLAFFFEPETKTEINEILMTFLPYFVFIMYAINRGTVFTKALFMNCDHSLLTYSFYKQPKMVLKLFSIRLREIIKINLVPAAVIGGGLALMLWASGGTDHPLDYAVLVVSILCMSMFFSVHYLTIYYLLQPYNAGTEMKSGTYQIVLSVTYLACFLLMQLRMEILLFGMLCIAFCVLYGAAACILVYKLAPKTFRLRS